MASALNPARLLGASMTLVRRRGARVLLVAAGIVLASLVVVALARIEASERSLVRAEVAKLSALADTRVAEIELVTSGYRQKADLVASRTRLRQLLAGAEGVSQEEAQSAMTKIITDAAGSDPLIETVIVADLAGRVVTSTDGRQPGETLDELGIEHWFPPADDDRSRLHVLSDGTRIRLIATAPMDLDERHLGTGVVVLSESAAEPLMAATEFGQSGEVLVGFADPATGDPLFATPLRRIGSGDSLTGVGSPTDPILVAMDGRGAELVDDAVDYAGEPIIAVARPIPSLGWGLLAKVDHAEVAGQLRPIRVGFLTLGIGLVLFGAAAGSMVGRRFEDELLARVRAESQFTSMFTSAPIALLLVGADGEIHLANERARNLLAYDTDGLRGTNVDSLIPPAARSRHAELRADFLADASPRTMRLGQDVVAVTRDGRQVPVEVALTPIDTDDGPMVVAALVDLSERRQAANQLEERAAALERSNRDLDAFAYVASHDLKSPLRAIENLAGFVLEDSQGGLSPESRDDLLEIKQRSSRLMDLLNGLLQYARIGREEAEPVTIDVAEMINELAELYVSPSRFSLDIAPDLPHLHAPRPAAELVFRNLLMNAVAHHDRDEGRITVRGRTGNGSVAFVVEDDGPGIPEVHREQVFELFKTVDRRQRDSSGMGLAYIKRTVESHGGSVRIVSTTGRGTAVELRWPSETPATTSDGDQPVPRAPVIQPRRAEREPIDVVS